MKNLNELKVVLASASPRRKELLSLIFNEYDICPADCDEDLPEGIKAQEAVEYLSLINRILDNFELAQKMGGMTDEFLAFSGKYLREFVERRGIIK